MPPITPQKNPAVRAARHASLIAFSILSCGVMVERSGAQVLLQENFTFEGALTANGWSAVSGAGTNPINSTAPGLTYPNLPSSGVGNAASLTTSGEDDRKTYAATTTDIYTSCLINVSASQTAGDYFYSLSSGTTGFVGRLFAKSSGTGFQLGIQKGSTAPPTYVLTNLSFNTTYLVVIKVTKNSGTTSDDIASLWINPVLGGSETSPSATAGAGTDQGSIDSVLLRQGTAGNAPTVRVGSILVGTTWASVTPVATTAPSITSFSPLSGFPGDTVTINGVNFGATPAVRFNGLAAASPTVNPAGTQITAVVPGSATTGKITVEVAGQDTATSATDFAVIAPGTPLLNLSTNSIAGLNTTVGLASAATNYTVTGTNLGTTAVTVSPNSGLLQVGTNGSDFATSLSLTPIGGTISNTIFLRVASNNVLTNYSASVSHISGSASNSLAVSGAITNPAASLVANPTNIAGLNATTTAVPSAAQTFTLTGANLTNDVTVFAPEGFQVANDGATWGTSTSLTQTVGSVNGTISVRFAASSVFGPRTGSVTNVSTGITNRVAVSGSVPVPNVPGQIYWNFDTDTPTSGTGGDYATWTFPAITQNNNNGTTALLSTTSASSGYTNPFNVLASGTTNAGASARVGGFDASTNAFFEVQIVVPTSTTASITNISFGSRSTGTGPAAYSIRSSVDAFASDVITNALTTNSAWGMYVAPVSIALSNGTNTIRIYGYGSAAASSTAGTANWRVDDLTLALQSDPTAPSITVNPTSITTLAAVAGSVGTALPFGVSGSNLAGNLTVTAPANFEVSTTSATAVFGTTATITASGLLPATNVWVRIAQGVAAGSVGPANVVISGGGLAAPRNIPVSGNVTAPVGPTLTATPPTLSLGSVTQGIPGIASPISVSGTNLTANVIVTAPQGLELAASNSPSATYSSSATLIPAGGVLAATNVWVRLTGASAGSQSGNVTVASTGATPQNVAVSGTVEPPLTSLTLTGPLSTFATVERVASSPQSFTVRGTNLSGPVTVSAPGSLNLEFTTNTSSTYSTSLVLPLTGNSLSNTVFARIPTNAPIGGPTTNTITAASGLTNATLSAITLVSSNTTPFIVVNPTNLSGFGTTEGTASTAQTFTAAGTNLTAELVVASPAGFELSTNGASYTSAPISFAPVGGSAGGVVASDSSTNAAYSAGWASGVNGGTGFGPWVITVSNNPPAYFAGAFVGTPVAAGITGFGTNAFGLYANPAGTPATVSVDRPFLAPLKVGDTFSFQWAVNWDSGSGNKGFNIYAGGTSGTQLINVNQGDLPGNITFNGANAVTNFGTGPMTWSFTMVSDSVLSVTSTGRDGGTNIVFTTNITVSGPPDAARWYTTAMTAGDQRQSYFNNLQIATPATGGTVSPQTISARIATNAPVTNSLSGNVNASSTGATTRTVALSGSVAAAGTALINVAPTNLTGFSALVGSPSSNQKVAVSSLNLGGSSITVQSTNSFYEISTNNFVGGGTNQILLPQSGGDLLVRISTNAPATNSLIGGLALFGGGATNNVPLSGTVNKPTVTATSTNLQPFSTVVGTPSPAQSFNAGGSSLIGDITITAPGGFAVSTNESDVTLTNSLILTRVGTTVASTPIFLRLTGASAGSPTGNVTVASSGADPQSFAVSGSVIARSLTALPALLTGFSTTVGTPSANQAFNVVGQGLTSSVTVIPPAGWEVSATNTNNFGSAAVTIATNASGAVGPVDVFLRIGPSIAPTNFVNVPVTVTSGSLSNNVLASGTVLTPLLSSIPTALTGFTATRGSNSLSQTSSVVGTNFGTNRITVTNTGFYEISTNNFTTATNFLTLAPTGGSVAVRIATNAPTTNSLVGSIVYSGLGISNTVSLSGVVTNPPPSVTATTHSLTGFSTVETVPSAFQSFTASGTNLTSNITITALDPTNFAISFSNNAGYTNTLTLTNPNPAGGATNRSIFVRMTGSNSGTFNSLVSLVAGSASTNVTVSGTVGAPAVNVNTNALTNLTTTLSNPSSFASFTAGGTNLAQSLTVAVDSNNFAISLANDGTGMTNLITLATNSSYVVTNRTIYVRMTGASIGAFATNISLTSGRISTNVLVAGTVPQPGITPSPTTLSNFVTSQGVASEAKSLSVATTNFGAAGLGNNNITVTNTGFYEMSTNGFATPGTNLLTLSSTGGVVALRIATNAPVTNNLAGSVVISGLNVSTNVSLSGTVYPFLPPSVQLVSPTNNPTIATNGATIRLVATATDTNATGGPGTISTLQFRTNGVAIPGAVTNNAASGVTFTFDWQPAASALPTEVTALAIDNNNLSNVSTGITVRSAIPGEAVPTFQPPVPDGPVRAMVTDPQSQFLYVAGQFGNFVTLSNQTPIATNVARNAAMLSALTGQFLTNFSANPGGEVFAMIYGTNSAASNAWVYVAGRFESAVTNNGVASTNVSLLKRLNATSGVVDPGFLPNLVGTNSVPEARALALAFATNGQLLVGGSFDGVIKAINTTNGAISNLPVVLDGAVQAIAVQAHDGKIVIGGYFDRARSTYANTNGTVSVIEGGRSLARLRSDGRVDARQVSGVWEPAFVTGSGVTAGLNGPVNTIALDINNNAIYAGGLFSSYNGNNYRLGLVAVDMLRSPLNEALPLEREAGTLQGQFNFAPGLNNAVNALAVDTSGDLLVGGEFVAAGNRLLGIDPAQPVGRVVQFKPAGLIDNNFNAGGSGADNNAVLSVIKLPNGNLAVGGSFTSYNGNTNLSHLAMIFGDSAAPVGRSLKEVMPGLQPVPAALPAEGSTDPEVKALVSDPLQPSPEPTPAAVTSSEEQETAAPPETKTSVDDELVYTTQALPKPMPTPSMAQRAAGQYVGHLASNALNGRRGASLGVTVRTNGRVEGQLLIGDRTRSIQGTINTRGVVAARTTSLKGQPNYTLSLSFADKARSAGARLSGHLLAGRDKAPVSLLASPWTKAKPARSYQGRYNISFTDAAAKRRVSASTATAELTIGADGTARLVGRMSDRRPFSWAGRLAADGTVAVHAVDGGSSLSGALRIASGNRAISGSLLWVRSQASKPAIRMQINASGKPAPAPRSPKLGRSESVWLPGLHRPWWKKTTPPLALQPKSLHLPPFFQELEPTAPMPGLVLSLNTPHRVSASSLRGGVPRVEGRNYPRFN